MHPCVTRPVTIKVVSLLGHPCARARHASPLPMPVTARRPATAFFTTVAVLGGFLFGFDSGVINGTVDALAAALGSNAAVTGFNVASMLLGCAAGALLAGRLADRYGRRRVLIVAALAFSVSAWGSGIATGSAEFVVYRVLGGLAVGAASVLVPAYIAEIAPAASRGRFGTVQQLAIVVGLAAAFFSNYAIATQAGGAGAVFWLGHQAWQWMFWAEMLPAALFFVLLFLIPESPRYLVVAGREAEAARVLTRVLGEDDARRRLIEIKASFSTDHRPRFTDLVDRVRGRLHPIVWVGIGLAVLQQLTGINVIFYYGAVLWTAAGFTESHALLINVVTAVINIGTTLVALLLMDRVGRRRLLLVGSVGMTVTLLAVAAIFGFAGEAVNGQLQLSRTAGIAALLCANLYVIAFALSWGPAVWVLLGEIFPNRYRGAAIGLAGLALWLANFVVTLTFPLLLTGLGLAAAYLIYGAFGVVSFFFVRRTVAETTGRELEAMTDAAPTS
jgi:MFS transporter, SP family, sugar:H+ symporter